jgi:hypothetical protein
MEVILIFAVSLEFMSLPYRPIGLAIRCSLAVVTAGHCGRATGGLYQEKPEGCRDVNHCQKFGGCFRGRLNLY